MRGDPQVAIKRIREAGYHVSVEHTRYAEGEAELMRARREGRAWKPPRNPIGVSAKGGITTVTLGVNLSGESGPPIYKTVAVGRAFCSPYDNFSKNLGLRIALGRAIRATPETLHVH